MVGDNPQADVRGAESAGIPAILVSRGGARELGAAPDLLTAAERIISSTTNEA